MSHLKSRLPQIGRENGSLKAYEGVFRYKIVCILQCSFGMHSRTYIPCGRDFLALLSIVRAKPPSRTHLGKRLCLSISIFAIIPLIKKVVSVYVALLLLDRLTSQLTLIYVNLLLKSLYSQKEKLRTRKITGAKYLEWIERPHAM